ncbi:MAG: amidase [Acidimicrobiia bacterium]
MTDFAFLDATAQAELVRTGEASPAELVDSAIERVERVNPQLNAVIHPQFDQARATVANGVPDGPFTGVPVVIKDLDGALEGAPNHRGNRLLKAVGHIDDHDTYLNSRLKRAGFVVVGRTNTPEFGLQPTTEPLAYGPTRNPWNTEYSPGGSSGGSAAAVASGMVPVGHAGDGGGSIRIPASECGLFGLKPSRGRVSLGPDQSESWHGLVQRHVVTRSVRDSAAILDVLAGYEVGDAYTAPLPTQPYASEVGADPGRLRIALCTFPIAGLAEVDAECEAAVQDAARLLESLGHTVEEVTPAAYQQGGEAFGAFFTLLSSWVTHEVDTAAALAGREVNADDFEPLTWMYAEMGRATTAPTYIAAVETLHRWARDAMSFFDTSTRTPSSGFDLLLTPTLACTPPAIGHLVADADNALEVAGRATPVAAFTAPGNITGQPGMSVPLYWEASTNLPIGTQLLAGMFREDLLFRVAAQLETARPWADRHPVVHAGRF